ncbi:MBL fold metallo-hydrolase [Alloalcanivorax mobilis]|uniref:MBL fold metallo-hydrolase n=1 Tax=Alloalcanivorax mobilis TaxID=2019569 RepID=UPI000B5B1DE5|nr:MBL fold metallo-hydrolase [Alloalcanivorax mobilis]ASK34610.1 MBL fold metallo-hydrolase [Alcanivorax sp. N3-2A]
MQLASLGSGSKGNGTVIRAGDTLILVDCGFSLRDTEARLARLGIAAGDLAAVLITHEHGDHVRGAGALARRHKVPLYSTFGTARAVADRPAGFHGGAWQEVRPGREFAVGGITVTPVTVPHDAREPCQYRFGWRGRELGVLTDLGSLTAHVVEAYQECDALVLECNHDPQMLAAGPYPSSLKRRVGGHLGHLSNQQAATLLGHCNVDRLQHLVLSHLSEQNNTPQHALTQIHRAVEHGRERIRVASQQQGFDWLDIL